MEFGKVHDALILDQIDWTLPRFDPLTLPFLTKQDSTPTKLFIGAPAFSQKEWLGKIYPAKTKIADYLYFYSRYFNSIEFNTTHYRIPTREQTAKWCQQTPNDFLFCPKVYQGISHDRRGMIDVDLLKAWFHFLENLQGRCGPCFLQLPPSFDYSWKSVLFQFLQNWPKQFRLAVEFRHPSWFHDGVIRSALTQYLQSRQIGLVITDVAGRRDVLHSSVSANFTMIRFIGNSLHTTDLQRSSLWNQRLQTWADQGLREVFFFVHQPDDIYVPEMSEELKKLSFFSPRFNRSFHRDDDLLFHKR